MAIRALPAATLRSTDKLFASLSNVRYYKRSNYHNNHTTAKLIINYIKCRKCTMRDLRFSIYYCQSMSETWALQSTSDYKRRSLRVNAECCITNLHI